EISLAAGETNAARDAADQLMQLASDVNAPLLDAIASRANGDVLLASGDIDRALTALRHAFSLFRELDAPFDEARVRVMLAEACQKQKDCDTAELELDVAGRIFEQLGAAWDRSRVDELVKRWKVTPSDTLTRREAEVLKLVAAGKTNRDIATELF